MRPSRLVQAGGAGHLGKLRYSRAKAQESNRQVRKYSVGANVKPDSRKCDDRDLAVKNAFAAYPVSSTAKPRRAISVSAP